MVQITGLQLLVEDFGRSIELRSVACCATELRTVLRTSEREGVYSHITQTTGGVIVFCPIIYPRKMI